MFIKRIITDNKTFTKFLPLLGLLSGCSIFPEYDPAAQYTLNPPLKVTVEANQSPSSVLIDTPRADSSLNTQRIAVLKTEFRRDYYADSQWTDKLPRLVQDIFVQTFQDANKFKSVGRTDSGILSDYMLQSDLRDFAAHYDGTGETPRIRINAHVRLLDLKDRQIESSRVFTLEQQAPENNLESIISTFNNQVQALALEVFKWALEESQRSSSVATEPTSEEDPKVASESSKHGA